MTATDLHGTDAHEVPARGLAQQRDDYIDLCRAFSLCIVVIWHWVFTILIWRSTGPYANNPIGFTSKLWPVTWLFQVLPLFFFVGGFAHETVWNKMRARGQTYGAFVTGRLRRLLIPSFALLGTWVVLGVVAAAVTESDTWIRRAVVLIVSPLWFIAVYAVLVAMAPAMLSLHRRLGPLAIVLLVGLAGIIDVLRFSKGLDWVSLLNLVVVWALCHQLGFFYDDLVAAPRTTHWSIALGGLFGLGCLVVSDLYPGSMVGVPGNRISNMGPPTLCIVALCFFQAGTALLIRPWVMARVERPRWRRMNDVVNRFALPLFLFHTTGLALALVIVKVVFNHLPPEEPTLRWWLERPLWLGLPLLLTTPIILVFGKRWVDPSSAPKRPGRARRFIGLTGRW